MALSNSFYEAVKEGNVRRVRIMMKDSLLVDPTFTDFKNMVKAASSLTGLYDTHDGRELISDEQQWTDEYMDKLMVQVVNNFSHERIEHLKNVVRYLRPVRELHPTSSKRKTEHCTDHQTKSSSYQEQKYRDQQNGNYRGTKIVAGAVAGAVVGGVVASVVGVTVVGGVVAGALVGGAAAVTVSNERR